MKNPSIAALAFATLSISLGCNPPTASPEVIEYDASDEELRRNCDDGNPCTIDERIGRRCRHTTIPGCGLADMAGPPPSDMATGPTPDMSEPPPPPPPPEAGWTVLTPSSDTRKVYVSSSAGNDANTGLSEASPVRTLDRGYELLREGYPDWLLLKSGDTFVESLPSVRKNGRSATEKMVMGRYGSGARPILRIASGEDAIIYITVWEGLPAVKHWAFVDMDFQGPGPLTSAFRILGNVEDVLIEGNRMNHFGTAIVAQAYLNFDTMVPTHMRDLSIRFNVIEHSSFAAGSNSRAMGIFAGADFNEANLNGPRSTLRNLLVENNVLHENGVQDGTTTSYGESHNVYLNGYDQSLSYNFVVRNNIMTWTDGGKMTAYGLLIENNLFLHTAASVIACCQGDTDWTNPTRILRNVQIDSSLSQVNPYTTQGFGFYLQPVYTEIAHNIITKLRATNYGIAMNLQTTPHARVHDNIVHDWFVPNRSGDFSGIALDGANYGDFEIKNNKFSFPNGGYPYSIDSSQWPFSGVISFVGNQYRFLTKMTRWPPAWLTFVEWLGAVDSTGESNTVSAFPDPNRDIATYMASIGAAAAQQSYAGFVSEATKMSRDNYRAQYTAKAVNDYIRAGFGMQ